MISSTQRKPWYRPRNIALALLLIVLVAGGWFVREVLKVYYGDPVISVDYRAKLQKLCEDAQPPGENAWPLLVEAAERTAEIVAEVKAQGWSPREEYDEGDVDFARVYEHAELPADIDRERRALEMMKDRGVFELVASAATMSRAVRRQDAIGSIFNEAMPFLSRLRLLAKANTARMHIAAAEAREDEFVEAFEQNLAIGRAVSFDPLLIPWLVGIAIHVMTFDEFSYLIIEHEFAVETCRRALAATQHYASVSPIGLALEGERSMSLDLIQRLYSDDGRGDGFLLPGASIDTLGGKADPDAPRLLPSIKCRFYYLRRAEATQILNDWVDRWMNIASTPPAERYGPAVDANATLNALMTPRRAVIISILTPSLERSVQTEATYLALAEAIRAMAALQVFRAEHGAYPVSLEELPPMLPRDPVTGGPFGYRLLSDDPHGREYLLYSIGLDGTDDGGTPLIEDGAQSVAPLTDFDLTGYDYILNEPRPVGDE